MSSLKCDNKHRKYGEAVLSGFKEKTDTERAIHVLLVKVGDEVIIMGTDGTHTILAEDIAKATGTINYEIICAFGQRLPKVYVKHEND
jgi:hypothetical protein